MQHFLKTNKQQKTKQKKNLTKHNESILLDIWKRAEFLIQEDLSHQQEQDLWETKRNRGTKEQTSLGTQQNASQLISLLHLAPG